VHEARSCNGYCLTNKQRSVLVAATDSRRLIRPLLAVVMLSKPFNKAHARKRAG
jgi:hypothetical protein